MKTVLWIGIVALVGIGILILITLRGEAAPKNYPPKNTTIVAFGDSLVAGVGATAGNDFVSQLSHRIGRPIVNLGVSGNTTADGLARVHEVRPYDPGIVILLLGGNDYLRRVPEATTREHLAELVRTFQEEGAVVVLLGVRGGVVRDGRDGMYDAIAKQYGAVYVSDVLGGVFMKPDLMADPIHPNDAGYAIIAERVHQALVAYDLI